MLSKIIRTVFMVASILCGVLLWFTRTEEWMPSLSSLANSENVAFYRAMHILATSFFMVHGAKTDRWINYVIGFCMGSILVFDMYAYPLLHNSFTVMALLLSMLYLIYFNRGFERSVGIVLCGLAAGFFILGYTEPTFHFLMAEIIAMAMIAVGMTREVWKK